MSVQVAASHTKLLNEILRRLPQYSGHSASVVKDEHFCSAETNDAFEILRALNSKVGSGMGGSHGSISKLRMLHRSGPAAKVATDAAALEPIAQCWGNHGEASSSKCLEVAETHRNCSSVQIQELAREEGECAFQHALLHARIAILVVIRGCTKSFSSFCTRSGTEEQKCRISFPLEHLSASKGVSDFLFALDTEFCGMNSLQ